MPHTEITFQAELESIQGVLLLRLSNEMSQALPSRGMVMMEGRINGLLPITAPAEPDGRGSHFIIIPAELADRAALRPGDRLNVVLSPAAIWPEPELPADFLEALTGSGLIDRWEACTVRGRWEWLRWLSATGNRETRQHRISVACDKLRKGEKRPCCFNAAACTVMEVSKSGILMDP